MNAYEKFLSDLSPDQKSKLAMYQCTWCSQLCTATKCGIPGGCEDPQCAPEKRVERAKSIFKKATP